MKKYKIKGTMSVDVEIEIDAENENAAISKFYAMDLVDIVKDGKVISTDSEVTEAKLAEGEFEIRVTNIAYDVNEYDIAGTYDMTDAEIADELERLKARLPKELVIVADCENNEEAIKSKIEDEIFMTYGVNPVDFDFTYKEKN